MNKMTEIIKISSLKEKLDEIDAHVYNEVYNGFYESRLRILMGIWGKGETIDIYIREFRGVNSPTYYQLMKETQRDDQSLKTWHDLYNKYPDKEKYIEEYARPKAKDWTKKALNPFSVHFLSKTSEWTTPEIIINKTIELFGEIDLDPCSNPDFPNVPAKTHFTKKDDGLSKEWKGKVYMNPPYGQEIKNWINHLCEQFEKGNTQEAIALTPSRTDTEWFQRMKTYPRCFIWGRLKFGDSGNSAPFPSMVVYFGKNKKGFIQIFSGTGDMYRLMK